MEFNKARHIIGLRVLSDNVIWLLVKDKSVVVVDPFVHEPVIKFIDENNFKLKAIFYLSLVDSIDKIVSLRRLSSNLIDKGFPISLAVE